MREARADAERILADAKREAREVFDSLRRTQAARVRFLRGFRSFVERQMEEIEGVEVRARDAGWVDHAETD